MKATNIYQKYLNDFGRFLGKIPKAIVSGFPTKKVSFKPDRSEDVHLKNTAFKEDSEKHYHRPNPHASVEKQTLIKETKKAKVIHK